MKGLTPVILIALSIGLFVYYVRPQYDQIGVLQAEQTRYDKALEAGAELQALKNTLIDKYNSFSTADLRRISKFLPEQIDDVRLILDINNIAEDAGFSLEEISIEDDTKVASGDARGGVTSTSETDINTLDVTFSFSATYGEFLDFTKDLETSLRIIDVTGLTFAPSETSNNTYNFTMTIKTYWLK